MADTKKPSKVEDIKDESIYLAGPLKEELADEASPKVSEEAYELLKFHGSYQGYNRDTATERKKAKLDKEWEFMVRMKAAAGRITAKQYLALDSIAENYANGTLRLTTRQTFQFHCIVKNNLKKHVAAINDLLLTTLGGCGDVVRNVMACPAPIKDDKHQRMFDDANRISEFTMPKTSAYHEIWLDDENLARTPDNTEVEPLYGKLYLPRKFKIGLAVPEDNTIDLFTHDLGFMLIYEGEEFKGYNIYLGGGMGMTHNKAETYPRLASPIAFIQPDDLLKATEAVIKLQRDHGDRSDRKHARLKYVVEENGLEWTRKTLEEYFGSPLEDPKPIGKVDIVDHMGWHEQGDGKWYLGVPVSSGRIADRENVKLRTGLYKVIEQYQTDLIMTADQNIILCDIDGKDKNAITHMLHDHGVKLREDITNVYRNMIACVALPTCGKALAEAERVKLPLVAEIEKVMEKHGIIDENIAVRLAGCPNGCPRPYIGDLGIVGRTPDHYAIFIGGNFEGTRLHKKILDRVPFDKLPDICDVMFAKFVKERQESEHFGDFCHRVGEDAVLAAIKDAFAAEHKWAA